MFGIALALMLQGAPPPATPTSQGWVQTGRLIDQTDFHLGLRPAVFYDGTEIDFGFTVQVSVLIQP